LLTDLLAPRTAVLPEQLEVPRLLNKHRVFYVTQKFITVFPRIQIAPFLSEIYLTHAWLSYFLKILWFLIEIAKHTN